MPEIVFLVGEPTNARNDNHLRLPQGFRDAGWQVTVLPHDCVRVHAGRLRLADFDPARFDLIWPLGFGRQASFFDRMQILRQVDQRRLVNTVDALVYLHGKYRWLELMPETHASNDVAALTRIVSSGGDWVAKPPAGSYGRDVRLIPAGADPEPVLAAVIGATQGGYCIVQRYVPEIAQGETRTILAGREIIGSYLRMPQRDMRANLSAGGLPEPTTLSASQRKLVQRLAEELRGAGAAFAAVDTAHGYLMEVNIANPGGLATLASLYGRDPTAAAVNAIIAYARATA